MRIVSTKLDNVDHDRLLEMCNTEGKSVSKYLRDSIQDCCRDFVESSELKENP